MAKLRVLFVCTGNSCRSQMAEGLLRHYAGDRFEAFSAGTDPIGVNPRAIEAMREIDIDISGHDSRSVHHYKHKEFDYVVTVCDSAKEACPVFMKAKRTLHWDIEDPFTAGGTSEEKQAVFRTVRNHLAQRIQQFIQETKKKK